MINCTLNKSELTAISQALSWKLEGTDWTIHNHANVFSYAGPDTDARFFIEHLPEDLEKETVDSGCDNGAIGMTLPAKDPEASVALVDESPTAAASSHLGMKSNTFEAPGRCEFMINNVLSGVEPLRFGAVLYNPSLCQRHALMDNIVRETFHHARRCPEINGELYIVASRYLGYFHKLKKTFDNYMTTVTNSKLMVLKAAKTGRRR